MARNYWDDEIGDSMRRENWALTGPKRIVKVMQLVPTLPRGSGPTPSPITTGAVDGYITTASSIAHKTPSEIESALGFRPGFLASGASIFNFRRLPHAHEYTYEGTAAHPGGLPQTFMSDSDYPPGSPKIHQWCIRYGMAIPVAAEFRLLPGQRFPG